MKKFILGAASILLFGLTACSNVTNNSTLSDNSSQSISSTNTTSVASKPNDETTSNSSFKKAFDGTELKGKNYGVKITDHKVIQPGEEGNEHGEKPVIAFWYDTTVSPNFKGSVDPSMAWIANFKVIQDNDPNKINELMVGSLPDDAYLQDQTATIKPGGTLAGAIAYTLTDEVTPVTVVAENFEGENFGQADFQIK